MFMKTHIPTPPLNDHIALFTFSKQFDPDYSATRILPDGSVGLFILLDDAQRVFYKDEQNHKDEKNVFTCKKALISGVQSEHIFAEATGYSILGIKFKAGGSYLFLQVPLSELNNLFVDAELVLGNTILTLREQLMELADPQAMFRHVERFLMERLAYSPQQERIVDPAIASLQRASPPASLKQTAESFGYSQKQFIHIFKKHVGLTPKYYQRVARFNRVLTAIETQRSIDWSQLAHACHFYDQSHLIHDFKLFSGIGLQEYLFQRGEFPNFVRVYEDR